MKASRSDRHDLRRPLLVASAWTEAKANDARLWHPWLRINRVLRVMLHTHWSVEAWSQVRVEFRRALRRVVHQLGVSLRGV
jgi:hypothetical protein